MEYSFKKYERLYKKKNIDDLFSNSKSLFSYPFKIFILEFEKKSDADLSKILISIPKKKFRKAFKRNSLKRKVRESYRLNKQIINSDKNKYFHIAFIYIGDENPDSKTLNSKMVKALNLIKS